MRTHVSFLLMALASIVAAPTVTAAQVQQPPPVVERIEPTSGPPGTIVQMIGRFFRPEQRLHLAGRDVEVLTRLPNRWAFRIPADATSGRIGIEVPGVVTVVGPEFRVLTAAPPPIIADFQPRHASPGAEVRIMGENFSPRITENIVLFGGQPVVVRSATPTELIVIVPEGRERGRFTVRVAGTGEATASLDLEIGTGISITSFSPTIGAPGTMVTLTGTGFSSRRTQQIVYLGNVACRVVEATPTTLRIQVPHGGTTGLFMVDVRRVGRAYATTPFTVQAAPVIASFDPPAGPAGTRVRIRGANFGQDVRALQVVFGNIVAQVRGLSDTEIIAEVPEGAATGPIQVSVAGIGPVVSSAPFTALIPPALRDFAPRSGPPGTDVVITGNGFSPVLASNRVTLSGVPCPVLRASPTELRVRIPQAASGPLTVDVEHAGHARASQPFVITRPPVIARFEPERAAPGSVIVIRGSHFGTNPALIEAAISDRRMEIRSASDQHIEAVIPQGAETGRIRVTVRLQGTSLSERDMIVLQDFSLAAIEPQSAHPGQAISIRGEGFARQGMQLRFTGTGEVMPYSFVTSREIRVYVPQGATSGPLTVRSPDGRESALPFTMAAPPAAIGITAVEPDCLRAGCRVIVRGFGFAPGRGRNTVTIGNQRMRVRRETATYLEFDLPRRPGTFTIQVDVRGVGIAESPPLTITR